MALAALLLVTVALALVAQPARTPDVGGFGHVMGWMQAMLYCIGAAAFLWAMAGLPVAMARCRSSPALRRSYCLSITTTTRRTMSPRPMPPPTAAMSRTTRAPATARPAAAGVLPRRSLRGGRPAPVRPRSAAPRPTPPPPPGWYTLVALGPDEGDMRAIADFDDPPALLDAVHEWRRRYPHEELRIFAPSGAQIASRAPQPAPAAARRPVALRSRATTPHQNLAAGGA
ncbi:MAG: hypothetical protein U0531_14145 [Dehalococcoidia bacterium]